MLALLKLIKKYIKLSLINLDQKKSLFTVDLSNVKKVNLGCASQKIPGFLGVDYLGSVDFRLDLRKGKLPFKDGSLESLICISTINYFTRSRAQEIISEVYRCLKPGGIARFGVQDLELLARRYINKDVDFFYQKTASGSERFEGNTLGDKFVAWFYGYPANGMTCKYIYDYDSLAFLFKEAGFLLVECKQYLDSRLENINLIDNRPEQMFFLEAVK
jgi:SAM-dependent methyltransferase